MSEKPDLLLLGPARPVFVDGLAPLYTVHSLPPQNADFVLSELAPRLTAIAVTSGVHQVDAALMARMPQLKIVAALGVGYDHIDARYAGAHGIVVTNTPDVLTEEVADTAIG